MKNLFNKALFFLSNDMNWFKTVTIMTIFALLAWAVPIIYTESNPSRYLRGDFQRWEVWWAIIGGLIGMCAGLFLRYIDKKRKEFRANQDRLKNV